MSGRDGGNRTVDDLLRVFGPEQFRERLTEAMSEIGAAVRESAAPGALTALLVLGQVVGELAAEVRELRALVSGVSEGDLDPAAPRGARNDHQKERGLFVSEVADPADSSRRIRVVGETLATLRLRRAAVRELRRDVKLGLVSVDDARRSIVGKLRFAEAWDTYVAGLPEYSRSRSDTYWKKMLAPYFATSTIDELTESALRTWQRKLAAEDYAPKTIRNIATSLKAAVNLAVREGRASIPWGGWKVPKGKSTEREACRSLEELESIVRAALEVDEARWARGEFSDASARVLTMALCGLRQGEAGGLGFDAVSLDVAPFTMKIRVQARDGWTRAHPEWLRPRDPPKGGNERELEMHDDVVAALRGQREQLRSHGLYRDDGPVFPSIPGGWAKRAETIERQLLAHGGWRTNATTIRPEDFKDLVKRAGLPGLAQWSPHGLRHSMISLELLANGGDLRAVQSRSGHADLEIIQTYVHRGTRGKQASSIGRVSVNVGAPAIAARSAAVTFDELAREWPRAAQGLPRRVKLAARAAADEVRARELLATGSERKARNAAWRARAEVIDDWNAALARARTEAK